MINFQIVKGSKKDSFHIFTIRKIKINNTNCNYFFFCCRYVHWIYTIFGWLLSTEQILWVQQISLKNLILKKLILIRSCFSRNDFKLMNCFEPRAENAFYIPGLFSFCNKYSHHDVERDTHALQVECIEYIQSG